MGELLLFGKNKRVSYNVEDKDLELFMAVLKEKARVENTTASEQFQRFLKKHTLEIEREYQSLFGFHPSDI